MAAADAIERLCLLVRGRKPTPDEYMQGFGLLILEAGTLIDRLRHALETLYGVTPHGKLNAGTTKSIEELIFPLRSSEQEIGIAIETKNPERYLLHNTEDGGVWKIVVGPDGEAHWGAAN